MTPYTLKVEIGDDPLIVLDEPPGERARVAVTDGELVIESSDLPSFRAAVDSHLRILECERKIYELVALRDGNG